mmetsp:Transcript_8672/g.14704  ORF Transcript_8672/g.14704 Transcript_8672/m.14704 type:complete len:104 (-) Transcript_8672:36-347(-)
MFLGGSSLKHGKTENSMQPNSCSSMKCFKCDKKVHRFVNAKWHSSVDYLFVRNYNTNVDQLRTGLIFEPGFSSYACQCKFISLLDIDQFACEQLQWMCGGHRK